MEVRLAGACERWNPDSLAPVLPRTQAAQALGVSRSTFNRRVLPIIETVERPRGWTGQAYTGDGVKINSGFLDGLTVVEAKRRAIDWLVEQGFGEAKINYRLRDWGISRQRYWGAPIPIVYCPTCGTVPERPENLPVVLPRNVQLTGKGGSPLADMPSFVNAPCPRCGGPGRVELPAELAQAHRRPVAKLGQPRRPGGVHRQGEQPRARAPAHPG